MEGKSLTNAHIATSHALIQVRCGDIRKHTMEKSQTNATNVIMHPFRQLEDTFENT